MPPLYLPREKPYEAPLIWRPAAVPRPTVAYLLLPSEVGGKSVCDWARSQRLTLTAAFGWSGGSLSSAGATSTSCTGAKVASGTSHTWSFRVNWDGRTGTDAQYIYDQQTTRATVCLIDANTKTKLSFYDGTYRLGPAPLTGWHTYTIVANGATSKLDFYTDGTAAVDGVTYTPVALAAATTQAWFGRYSDAGTSGRLTSAIEYVMLWADYAFTAAEAAAHYADPYMWLRERRRTFFVPPVAAAGNPWYAYAQGQ